MGFTYHDYIHHLRHGGRQQYYKHLLMALVVLLLISPATSGWVFGRILEAVVLLGLLVAGFLAISGKTVHGVLAVAMGLTMIVTGSLRVLGREPQWVTLAWLATGIIFFSHVTFILARDIFTTRERIDSGRLYGAVSVYLLVGLIFANAHYALETISPGSYQCGSPQCQLDYKPPVYLYFSFITLCSVGYGDILPASRFAGMLAYLEAITGQMYVAILVARLVGLHLSQSET